VGHARAREGDTLPAQERGHSCGKEAAQVMHLRGVGKEGVVRRRGVAAGSNRARWVLLWDGHLAETRTVLAPGEAGCGGDVERALAVCLDDVILVAPLHR